MPIDIKLGFWEDACVSLTSSPEKAFRTDQFHSYGYVYLIVSKLDSCLKLNLLTRVSGKVTNQPLFFLLYVRSPASLSHLFRARCYNGRQPERSPSKRECYQRGWINKRASCKSKPTFHPCTVFRQQLPEAALNCRWPADDCIVNYRTGGVTGDKTIVYDIYDIYALAARWTVHAKIDS